MFHHRQLKFALAAAAAAAALGLLPAAASAACLPAPPQLITPGTLTVGISLATPPTSFMKDDKAAGLDPELMTAIAEQMCLKPVFVNMAFAGLFPALIARKIDVIHSQVGITDVRKESFDFVPVFVGGVRIVSRKGSGLFFQSEQDTCGHSFSAMAGGTQMAALEKVKATCPADKPMALKPFSGQVEALNEVARGSAQAAFIDWSAATYAVMQKPESFEIGSPILSGKGPNTQRNRIGIVFRKGDSANQAAVAKAFDGVVQNGTYDTLLKRWGTGEGDIRKAN